MTGMLAPINDGGLFKKTVERLNDLLLVKRMLSLRNFSMIDVVDFAGLPVGSSANLSLIVPTTVSYASEKERRYRSRSCKSASLILPFRRSPKRSICALVTAFAISRKNEWVNG
jgi:hypothetical protein